MATLYPAALDTNDSLYVAVNGWSTNLTSDHDANTNILYVKTTTGTAATGVITIKGEAVKYTGKTPTSFTGCIRGYDNTAATNHFNNDLVEASPIADHHNALVGAVQAIEAKLGIGATINGAQIGNGTITSAKLATNTGSYKVRAYQTGGGALNVGAVTLLPIGSLTGSDTSNMFDSVNHKIICQLAGRYSVKACLTLNVANPTTNLLISVYKNGAEYSRGEQIPLANGGTPSLSYSDDIDLAVNDYLQVYAYIGSGSGTFWTPSTGAFNYISVALWP